jgi:hypothetical protein
MEWLDSIVSVANDYLWSYVLIENCVKPVILMAGRIAKKL